MKKKKKQPTSLLNIVIGMIRTIFTKVCEAMCSWSEASRWPLGARWFDLPLVWREFRTTPWPYWCRIRLRMTSPIRVSENRNCFVSSWVQCQFQIGESDWKIAWPNCSRSTNHVPRNRWALWRTAPLPVNCKARNDKSSLVLTHI